MMDEFTAAALELAVSVFVRRQPGATLNLSPEELHQGTDQQLCMRKMENGGLALWFEPAMGQAS